VKDTGYLPQVSAEEVEKTRSLSNNLLGLEEKWAIEAATTEAPQ